MAKPKRPTAKSRHGADAKVSVEFDYDEVSLLVVAASALLATTPDEEMRRIFSGLMDKLYKAEPRLKAEARRIQSEMRSSLAPIDVDIDYDGDEASLLDGAAYLPHIEAAIDEGRALSLSREDGVIALRPTGVGRIGGTAIAIGWSAAHEDYALVRLDEVIGIGAANPPARPAASDPVQACLTRLCRKPPLRGSLL